MAQCRLYLEPDCLSRQLPPGSRPLAGGPYSFSRCIRALRDERGAVLRESLPLDELGDEAAGVLERLTAPRAPFAGVDMTGPSVMGIVNVTPDSFSDGGERYAAEQAIADGLAMWEAGVAFVDVGGESTRPGAEPVPDEEEKRRVLPVIRELSAAGVRVSIDSYHASVMEAAIEAGAAVINDITALTGDPHSLELVAESGLPVILMHMQGRPQTMQKSPSYEDVALDILDFLEQRIERCLEAGIERERIAVDPGVGFGKTLDHNLELLNRLSVFHTLGCPILLGASRKTFISQLCGKLEPGERVSGTMATLLAGWTRGVQMHRVHDVAQALQTIRVWQAIEGAVER
ncbi:dihydropteroate synthase [Fodinicurvata fenggangensis]|uniref:dihydropteroate synthase n=1 Tax=Fodinicurvata fenggangensis TaxID=1121830 RepID=UPI000479DDFA|nr:dihydropteroate synthase [Fodinicurvata fenggangensis]